MGCTCSCSKILLIIILFLMSFPFFTHFLTVKKTSFSNAQEFFNVWRLFDENAKRENRILEKLRSLIELKEFYMGGNAYLGYHDFGSSLPALGPCPAEAPAPAPAPSPEAVPPLHGHFHSPAHRRHHLVPEVHKIQRKEKGKSRKIITAVLVSAGVGSLFCAFGVFWGCKKFNKKRKKTARTVSIYCTESGNGGNSKPVGGAASQITVKKVNSDSGPDLFYLDSLGAALELEPQQPFCLKQNSVTSNSDNKRVLKSEGLSDSDGFSSAGEIISAHDDDEAVESKNLEDDKEDYVGCSLNSRSPIVEQIGLVVESKTNPYNNGWAGDNIIQEVADSSDDESFHSVCNSNSSEMRLSNVSAGSVSENSGIMSNNPSESNENLNPLLSHPPPPPTPPPPPPPLPSTSSFLHSTTSKSTPFQKNMTKNVLSSAALPESSSTRSSVPSSESSNIPLSDLSPSPVNPPRPSNGIPPPPCPPPFPKIGSNSLKTPPPPPPLFSEISPLGKDGVPLPKLKPLHWDKVRATPDRTTVWDKLRSSSFEFDEEMIESLFGYNLQNSMKNDELLRTKTPSPTKHHVLEPKRLQNITILSKALNMTADQVCDALIQGKGLSLQELEALSKMVPTKEEEAKLSNYKGINELVSAEKLVKAMLKIPFAFSRIEAMLYRETFDDEVIHLRKSFSMLEEACTELRSSRLFLKLLEAALKTGNRMNIGTIRGGAKAFKLDALLKLADVKGTDGKTTLLHFVVQEIVRSEGFRVSESIMGKINQRSKGSSSTQQDKEEDYRRMGLDLVSGLSTELCNAKKTASIDLDVLASSVSNLSDGMRKLKQLVYKDLLTEEKTGNFVHSIRSFLEYAEKKMKELQEDENRVLLHVREITEYFHGDVSKEESNPLRIFVIVRDFLALLDHVCKELRSMKSSNSPNPLSPFR